MEELKRLFLAMEVVAPWPTRFPEGRVVAENERHLTLAFLGYAKLPTFDDFPTPPFQFAIGGILDKPLFLPPHHPHVAAWHFQFLEQEAVFLQYHQEILNWFKAKGFQLKEVEFTPHITIARSPFRVHDWAGNFSKLPCYARNIRLCESHKSSRYEICWEKAIASPFERVSDRLYVVRGEGFQQLFIHSILALTFADPLLIDQYTHVDVGNLEELINGLIKNCGKRVSRQSRMKSDTELELVLDK